MSTPCEFYVDAIAELTTGGLEPERQRRLERHLAECRDCAAQLETARAVRGATAPVPEGLEARIRVAVRAAAVEQAGAAGSGSVEVHRPQRAGRVRRWRPWAVPLAAAAALALVWVGLDEITRDPAVGGEALVAETELAPYGAWPASDGRIAGDPLLSELSEEQLERLLEEMGS